MKPKLTIVIGFLIAASVITYVYMSNQHRPAPKNMVAVMAGYRDRMCACKDAACRDAVGKELTAWTQSLSGASPEQSEIDKFNAVSNEMTACMTGSGAPGAAATPGTAPATPAPGTAAGPEDRRLE